MTETDNQIHNTRIGLHYYPDTIHYRIDDLKHWLPIFRQKKINWLILKADAERAIPEFFLRALIKANIQPIIEFNLPIDQLPQSKDFKILLQVYARWGVRYVILFDRPNQKSSWKTASWTQQDLVDRFLDQYIPIARIVLDEGLIPVFPPLEPGGNYWDTAFLRGAIKGLVRRKQDSILQNLVLSAYGHTNQRNLNWGLGGPQRWPQTRPYFTPEDSEDQQGFRIFEWYLSITHSLLQKNVPIIMLQSGFPSFPEKFLSKTPLSNQVWDDQAEIIKQLSISTISNQESIPSDVMCCNFWLLASDEGTPYYHHGWYQGEHCLIPEIPSNTNQHDELINVNPETETTSSQKHPIKHYVLLPTYEWGIADWHLEVIQPFIKKHKATIGFSIEEAKLASKVTIIGNPQTFPEEKLQDIRSAGSFVERISGDGTSIATQLAER
ncbi:MAG: hypothetical protein CL609_01635 [Anaerolineaceae bacterium]|nr:hypothetical protein [Anaerolineaceae bacterium]